MLQLACFSSHLFSLMSVLLRITPVPQQASEEANDFGTGNNTLTLFPCIDPTWLSNINLMGTQLSIYVMAKNTFATCGYCNLFPVSAVQICRSFHTFPPIFSQAHLDMVTNEIMIWYYIHLLGPQGYPDGCLSVESPHGPVWASHSLLWISLQNLQPSFRFIRPADTRQWFTGPAELRPSTAFLYLPVFLSFVGPLLPLHLSSHSLLSFASLQQYFIL